MKSHWSKGCDGGSSLFLDMKRIQLCIRGNHTCALNVFIQMFNIIKQSCWNCAGAIFCPSGDNIKLLGLPCDSITVMTGKWLMTFFFLTHWGWNCLFIRRSERGGLLAAFEHMQPQRKVGVTPPGAGKGVNWVFSPRYYVLEGCYP